MRTLLIVVLSLLTLALVASATTYTINATTTGSVDAGSGTPFISDPDLVIYMGGADDLTDVRGFMKFDVSSIVVNPGDVISSVTVDYYGFHSNYPWYDIYALANDPATSTPGVIYTDCGDGSMYLNYTGGSLPWPAWRSYDLGAQASTDLGAAIGTTNWFGIGFDETDTSPSYYDSCYGAAGSRCPLTYEPFLTVEVGSAPPPPPPPCDYYWGNSLGGGNGYSYPYYLWRDVTTNSLPVGTTYGIQNGILSDDDWEGPFPIGFNFPYYENWYTQFCICSNGMITLGTTGNTSYSNTYIPNTSSPNLYLGWFWDDMNAGDPDVGGTAVYWGNGTNGDLVVSFINYPRYGASSANDGITAQVILEPSGNIKYQYGAIGSGMVLTSCTIGIENHLGTVGVQYLYNGTGNTIQCNMAIEFGCDPYALPVELTSFDAIAMNQGVRLQWNTASETNNSSFALYRSTSADGQFTRIASISGAGESATENEYNYVDRNLVNGTTYFYRLSDVDINGVETVHDITVSATPVHGALGVFVEEYKLHQNYPNPFNPTTTITYDVKEAGHVTLTVYNVVGQQVATVVDQVQESNRYQVTFDASGLAAGVYFYRVNVNDYNDVAKMVILK